MVTMDAKTAGGRNKRTVARSFNKTNRTNRGLSPLDTISIPRLSPISYTHTHPKATEA